MKKTLLFFTLFSFTISFSQTIFQDDFSTYTIGQELNGQGVWTNNSASPNVGIGACLPPTVDPCSNAKILNQAISYLNFGNAPKSLEIAPIKDGVARAITPMITGGDFYVAVVLNLSSAPATSPSDFFRINNGGNGTGSEVAFRMLVQDAGFGYKVGIRKGASSNTTTYTTDLYNYNENVLIVLKYAQLVGANDDVLNVYVNPDFAAGEPTTPSATTSNGFDQSGYIDRYIFRQNYNIVASMPTGFVGLASTSLNWEGLGFISLGLNQINSENAFVFSSNSQNIVFIDSKLKIDNAIFKMYTITGTLIEDRKISISKGKSEITTLSTIKTGIYIIKLTDASGKNYTQKLIIQK